MIKSVGRCPFLSEQLGLSCVRPQQAFRLRLRAYQAAAFRSFCSQTIASPRPFHLSVPVKVPLATSTVKPVYTRKIGSQVESTLTIALILWAFCGNPVDLPVQKMWIKLWKIGQVICMSDLPFWVIFLRVCSSQKCASEKKYFCFALWVRLNKVKVFLAGLVQPKRNELSFLGSFGIFLQWTQTKSHNKIRISMIGRTHTSIFPTSKRRSKHLER